MTVWIITAIFQGVYDGIQVATRHEQRAHQEFERLVRESMYMPDEPWSEVVSAYEDASASCAKIEEYYIDIVEIT